MKALSILALSLSLAATSFGYLIYDGPDGYFPHIGSTYSECADIWGSPISFKTTTDIQHAETIYHFEDNSDSDFVDVTIPSWDNKVWSISYYGNPITPDQVPWLLRMNAPEGAVWTELKGTPGVNQNWRLNLEGYYLLAHYYTNKSFDIAIVGENGRIPISASVLSTSTPTPTAMPTPTATPTPTPAPVISAKPVLMDDVQWIAWYYHQSSAMAELMYDANPRNIHNFRLALRVGTVDPTVDPPPRPYKYDENDRRHGGGGMQGESGYTPTATQPLAPTLTPTLQTNSPLSDEEALSRFNALQDRHHKPRANSVHYNSQADSYKWIGPSTGRRMSLPRVEFEKEMND